MSAHDADVASIVDGSVPLHLWSRTPQGALYAAVQAQPARTRWRWLLRRACLHATAAAAAAEATQCGRRAHNNSNNDGDTSSNGRSSLSANDMSTRPAVVLAGVVLSVAHSHRDATRRFVCVSLGSGTRCCGAAAAAAASSSLHTCSARLPSPPLRTRPHNDKHAGDDGGERADGQTLYPLVLRDGHAEVMARRGFVAFLLDAIASATHASQTCNDETTATARRQSATLSATEQPCMCGGGGVCGTTHPFVMPCNDDDGGGDCMHGRHAHGDAPLTRARRRGAVSHTTVTLRKQTDHATCTTGLSRWRLREGVRVHLVCTHWPCGGLARAAMRQPSGRVLLRAPLSCTRCAWAVAHPGTSSSRHDTTSSPPPVLAPCTRVQPRRQQQTQTQQQQQQQPSAMVQCVAPCRCALCRGGGCDTDGRPVVHVAGHVVAAHRSAADTPLAHTRDAHVTCVKPGKGHANLNMSCSDKLWRWGQVGLHGRRRDALLSRHATHLYSVHVGLAVGVDDAATTRRGRDAAAMSVRNDDDDDDDDDDNHSGTRCTDALTMSSIVAAQGVYDARAHALPWTAYASSLTPSGVRVCVGDDAASAPRQSTTSASLVHVLPLVVPFALDDALRAMRAAHDDDDNNNNDDDDDSCFSRAAWMTTVHRRDARTSSTTAATTTTTTTTRLANSSASCVRCNTKRPRSSSRRRTCDDEAAAADAGVSRGACASDVTAACLCVQWDSDADAGHALVLNTKHGLPRGVTMAHAWRVARAHDEVTRAQAETPCIATTAAAATTTTATRSAATAAAAAATARTRGACEDDTDSDVTCAPSPPSPPPPARPHGQAHDLERLLTRAAQLTARFPLSRAWMAVCVLRLVPHPPRASVPVHDLHTCAAVVRALDEYTDALHSVAQRRDGEVGDDLCDGGAARACACQQRGCLSSLLRWRCEHDMAVDDGEVTHNAHVMPHHDMLWVHKSH